MLLHDGSSMKDFALLKMSKRRDYMKAGMIASEDKFNDVNVIRSSLREAKIGLWVIELEDGKEPRMFADDSMLELLGVTDNVTPEECYAFWYGCIGRQYVGRVQEAVGKLLAFEFAEVHYEYNHPGAGRIFVRCGGVRDSKEKRFVSLSGYHQNITDLQELSKERERLRTNNEELLGSLHNIFSSLYRVDLTSWNVVTMRSPDDALLASEVTYENFLERCTKYVHPDDVDTFLHDFSRENLQKLWVNGAMQFAREYRRKYSIGYRWVAFQIYYCELTGGRKWGILGTRDVHERRMLEEEKAQALADACQAAEASSLAKMEFLSRMSHDVRTPINAILGMTALAKAKKDDPEQVMACLDKIENAGNMLYRLVNEILDISRAESNQIHLEKEPLRISTLMRDSIEMVLPQATKQNLTITSEENVQHDYVLGDATRLREILLNFLTNAVKYTLPGGEIKLTVTELLASTGNNFGYQFECCDTGIGISKEFLPKVFEPFEREEDSRMTQIPGTGLGLAITRNLVTLMNGWIHVKSTKGEGSCFTATVYLEPQAEKADGEGEAAQAENEEIRLDGISVLVAEDNEINREIALELLRMAGAKVEGVENGLEAVNAYIQNPEQYDIILMDIKMPVMDGNEAARRIRELESYTGRRIPIIALTANSFAEDIAASLSAGIDKHLTKPYSQQELFLAIRELLSGGVL